MGPHADDAHRSPRSNWFVIPVSRLAFCEVLYTVYVYPFEIASGILLVAIVAAIGLTMRRREGRRYQDIAKQVGVRAEDRFSTR